MSGRYLEGVWKVFGRCLEGVWEVSGRFLEGVWKVYIFWDPNFFAIQILFFLDTKFLAAMSSSRSDDVTNSVCVCVCVSVCVKPIFTLRSYQCMSVIYHLGTYIGPP